MGSRQIPFDLVIARTLSGGIGRGNQLPWKLPTDLKMFKRITSSSPHGNAVIMGRKTFESMGNKPLPNRLNIILSKNTKIQENERIKQVSTLKDALSLSESVHPQGKAFVIGGSKIF